MIVCASSGADTELCNHFLTRIFLRQQQRLTDAVEIFVEIMALVIFVGYLLIFPSVAYAFGLSVTYLLGPIITIYIYALPEGKSPSLLGER